VSVTYWPAEHAAGFAGKLAVIVIGADPSKLTPLMARAVAKVVAVAALPVKAPADVMPVSVDPLESWNVSRFPDCPAPARMYPLVVPVIET
jgi:hypothetical protein